MGYLLANLFIIFSGFYITKLPISPIYIVFGLILFLSIIFFKDNLKLNSISIFSLVFMCYLLISQVFVQGESHTSVNVIVSLLYFPITYILIGNLDKDKIIKISNKFINASIILLIVECVWRLTHPVYLTSNHMTEDIRFYMYKFGSIMYQDSNFVGIFILVLFFFVLYLKSNFQYKGNFKLLLLLMLCIFTFSRASILSLILFYGVYKFFNLKNKSFILAYIGIIFTTVVIGVVLYSTYSFFNAGSSFNSKIFIIEQTKQFLLDANLKSKIFGVGFGNSINYLGIASHNIFVTYIVESGMIGLTLFIILNILICIKTRGAACIIMFPFLFNGLSLAGHAVTYLYAIYAVIYALNRNMNNSNINKITAV